MRKFNKGKAGGKDKIIEEMVKGGEMVVEWI